MNASTAHAPITSITPITPITRFILVQPSHPGNVGAVARAMKVMGFDDLVLVDPRYPDVLSHDEAVSLASGATDVLEKARVVATLEEAMVGVHTLCATAMTPRDFGPPTQAPREVLPTLAQRGHSVGFVLGSERYGMRNEDVYRCHVCLCIPTHPNYGSLNLAQAVQLLAYDWRQALGGFAVHDRRAEPNWADAAAVQRLLSAWQAALVDVEFFDPASPKKLMPRLNQLLNRQQLTQDEVHILHGVARAIGKLAATRGS